MCGIAGIIGSEEPDRLRDMLVLMRHRGPDQTGLHCKAKATLGITRLAIIDLKSGSQPMIHFRRKLWLVFNGEIYNFKELRQTLLQINPTPFVTRSDTEVILRAYEEWGEECPNRFRGMFSFAIWDEDQSELFLARDRLGKKPLYYGYRNGRFVFASELKSILASGYFESKVNPQAIDHYLSLRYPLGEESFIQGVYKLPPGHLLKFHQGQYKIKSYWNLRSQNKREEKNHSIQKIDPKEVEDQLWQLLIESTRMRLVSDVPLGVLLSGGIDSSLIVGLLSKLGTSPIKTFTIGYPKEAYPESCDETHKAREVANYFGTEHQEVEIGPQEVEILPTILWHLDEPIADEAILPTYFVCKEAKKTATVLLTGEGADEVFGGYPRYQLHLWAIAAKQWFPLRYGFKMAEKFPFPSSYRNGCQKILRNFQDSTERNLNWVQIFSEEEKVDLYTKDFKQSLKKEKFSTYLNSFLPSGYKKNSLEEVLFLDQKSWLVEDLLTKLDKMSMAASVEARAPFLDHHLVEFMDSLPISFKVSKFQTKRLFKKVAQRVLSKWVVKQKKQAFCVPLESWFKNGFKNFVKDQLLSERCAKRGQLNPVRVKYLVEEHFSGRRNFHTKIFTLLCLELWNQIFIDRSHQFFDKTNALFIP